MDNSTLSLASALDEGKEVNARPRSFYSREREPLPIAQVTMVGSVIKFCESGSLTVVTKHLTTILQF